MIPFYEKTYLVGFWICFIFFGFKDLFEFRLGFCRGVISCQALIGHLFFFMGELYIYVFGQMGELYGPW